jgi:hypothetical protein
LVDWATATIHSTRNGIDLSDQQNSRAFAAMYGASSYTWQAKIRNFDMNVGDRVVPLGKKRKPLHVMASELCFDLGLPIESQLSNVVLATASETPPPELNAPPPVIPSDPFFGQVCSVNDPRKLGRVKVSLPWHNRPSADPSSWQGIWVRVEQQTAGRSQEGQNFGSLVLPGLLNWGKVELKPASFSSPDFRTSYFGRASLPDAAVAPSTEQLLFSLPGGAVFLVGFGAGGYIKLAIRKPDGSDICRISLSSDGMIDILGKVNIRNQE